MTKTLSYKYNFEFNDGQKICLDAVLDEKSLELVVPKRDSYPAWAKLDHHQCPHCPLSKQEYEHCPIAMNLSNLVDSFKTRQSIDEVLIRVETENRVFEKKGPLQKGLSSLMGIYMVSSGCPVMAKLKPMVRHHMPFARNYETFYRVISMYLMAQFFIYRKGGTPDWDLKGLSTIYEDVRTVNITFSKRLAGIEEEDASKNALVILDFFALDATMRIDNELFQNLEDFFSS